MNSKKVLTKCSGLLVAGLVLGLGGLAAFAAGKKMLVYKLKKGQKLQYEILTTAEQTQEQMGQEVTINSDGESTVDVLVEDVDAKGNITLVYNLSGMKTRVHMPMMDTTFVNPEAIIGKRSRQVITAGGRKVKSEQVDSLNITGMLAQSGAGRSNSLQFPTLPDHEVGVGDTWTAGQPDTNNVMGSKTITQPNISYTVSGEVDTLGHKCFRLSYKGDLSLKGDGKMMGMTFFIEGSGPIGGTAYFSPDAGLLVANIANMDIDMTIALTGQMQMTIPASSSSQVKMRLKQ